MCTTTWTRSPDGTTARLRAALLEEFLGDVPQSVGAVRVGRNLQRSFRGNISPGSRTASTATSIALRTTAPISGGKRAFKTNSPSTS